MMDIGTTEETRMKSEKHIAELESENFRLRRLLNSTAEGIYVIDMDGNCKFCNAAALRMLEYSDFSEVRGRNMHELIHHTRNDGSHFPIDECRIFRAFKDGINIHVDDEVLWTKQGRSFPFEYWSYPIRDDNQITGAVVTFFDITERMAEKRILQESIDKFKAIFENSSISMAIVEPDTTISMANTGFFKVTGFSEEEIIGTSWTRVIPPDDLERLLDYNRRRLQNPADAPENYEFTFYRKNGEIRHGLVSVAMINSIRKIIISVIDITERIKAEAELRKMSQAVQQSPANIIITNIEGAIEYVNPKCTETTGYSCEELIGENPRILKSGETSESDYGLLWKTITSGREWRGIFHNKKKSGELYWEAATIAPITDKNGVITHFLAVKEDITEQRKAENALHESEEKFKAIANYAASFEAWFNPDGKPIWFNPSIVELTGFTAEEYIAADDFLSVFCSPEDHEMVLGHFKLAMVGGSGKNLEFRALRKDGSKVWVNVSWRSILNSSGRMMGFRTSTQDITERKKVEMQIAVQNQQLQELNATKDKFFSIIAHDLRSPFNTILGFSNLLSKNLESYNSEEVRQYTNAIARSSKEAFNLLENLLLWARSQSGKMEVQPDIIEIKRRVNEIIEIVELQAEKKNIRIVSLISDHYVVYADSNMFNTILLNLLTNAIKYTTSDGNITVFANKQAGQVEISIKDTGVGIPKEKLESIFRIDNKKSTLGTANEKGSGLGLILCREFVEKNGGTIRVESEPGRGSTFKITLPLLS